MINQPLQSDVNVVSLLAADGITTNLTILDDVQIHSLYEPGLIQCSRKITFITKD
jgi:hypothetical protein